MIEELAVLCGFFLVVNFLPVGCRDVQNTSFLVLKGVGKYVLRGHILVTLPWADWFFSW